PGLVLPHRPRRARRAAAAAPVREGLPAARQGSLLRWADQGGGAAPHRRSVDRARADARPARALRLRLQPRHVLLVLPRRRLARVHGRGAEQHVRRAPTGGAARAFAPLRAPQAAARLALLRPRPELRVRVLATGGRGLGADPRPRRRRAEAADRGAPWE